MKVARFLVNCVCPIFLLVLAVSASPAEALAATGSGTDVFHNLNFRNLGPAIAGGRVTATVGIPGNPNIYYVGAAGGGVFKTVDGGLHWPGRLNRELHSLNSFGRNILQPPTPQELANAASIRAELNSKLDQFNTLLTTDVANYNKRAFAAGAPTLMTGAPISVHKTSM